MAEAIARAELERRGWSGLEVGSAGTSAYPGQPASGGALRAAERHGLDLSAHRARPLTPELVAETDLLLAMTQSHWTQARWMGAGERAVMLTEFASGEVGAGVPDPFGGGDDEYEETFRALETLVRAALDRLAREAHATPGPASPDDPGASADPLGSEEPGKGP